MTKVVTPAASAWATWAGFSLDVMTTGVTVPPAMAESMPARFFARVDVVMVRRYRDFDYGVPVIVRGDYEVGFEELSKSVWCDSAILNGLRDGTGQPGVGGAGLGEGNVCSLEAQG